MENRRREEGRLLIFHDGAHVDDWVAARVVVVVALPDPQVAKKPFRGKSREGRKWQVERERERLACEKWKRGRGDNGPHVTDINNTHTKATYGLDSSHIYPKDATT